MIGDMNPQKAKFAKNLNGMDRAEKKAIIYDCGHCCRLCPFPGLKCIKSEHDLEAKTWKY